MQPIADAAPKTEPKADLADPKAEPKAKGGRTKKGTSKAVKGVKEAWAPGHSAVIATHKVKYLKAS